MKKIFAVIAMFGLLSLGMTQSVMAQEAAAPADQENVAAVDSAAAAVTEAPAEVAPVVEEESQSFHKALKVKFIEGNAGFMSLVAIALIIGLATVKSSLLDTSFQTRLLPIDVPLTF